MIDNKIIKQIEDFVYKKPRSIQEIANYLKKNWRTVDRYVEEIIKNYGTIDKRIFREGTRGALKIIYWTSVEKASNSLFQEDLEKEIYLGKDKKDFSGFDIYQHIKSKEKEMWGGRANSEEELSNLDDLRKMILQAKKQILFFSGNLSFINYRDKKGDILKTIEEVIKKGVSVKVICRIDFPGKRNVEKLLALNFKYGKELIEVRHKVQPLRITIIDRDFFNIKEISDPTGRVNELDKKTFLFYTIKDKEWIDWITKIFWKMFNSSISAGKRIEELNRLNIKD